MLQAEHHCTDVKQFNRFEAGFYSRKIVIALHLHFLSRIAADLQYRVSAHGTKLTNLLFCEIVHQYSDAYGVSKQYLPWTFSVTELRDCLGPLQNGNEYSENCIIHSLMIFCKGVTSTVLLLNWSLAQRNKALLQV